MMTTQKQKGKYTMKITNDRIILDSDPRIRSKSEPVTLPLSKEDEELLRAMITYVRDSQTMRSPKEKGCVRPSASPPFSWGSPNS